MTFLKIATMVMGVLMSLAYYPQAYKMLKKKSVKDVSKITYSIFALGTLVWFIYGLVLEDIIIIFGFALGVIGSWLVLILSFVFGEKRG